MKKLLATLVATAGLFTAAAGVATAAPGEGQGNSDHGLCTAYFNGQKVGHDGGEGESGDYPKPFEGLEDRSEDFTDSDENDNDYDGSTDAADTTPESEELTDAENIFNYCNDGGLIGGSPEHGRFSCIVQAPSTHLPDGDPNQTDPVAAPGEQEEGDEISDPECGRNEKPGNGDDNVNASQGPNKNK